MVKPQQNDPEPTLSVNGQALEYMKEKYGEEFYFYSPWGNSMSGMRQFLAVCDSMPDQPVLVQIDNYKTEDKVFSDNYPVVKYQQEISDYLKEKFSSYYSKMDVLYLPSKQALSPSLAANADLEATLADENCTIVAYIVMGADEFQSRDQIEELAGSFTECAGSMQLILLFLSEENRSFSDVEELRAIVKSGSFEYYACINRNDNKVSIKWSGV